MNLTWLHLRRVGVYPTCSVLVFSQYFIADVCCFLYNRTKIGSQKKQRIKEKDKVYRQGRRLKKNVKRVKSKDEVNDSEIPKFTPEAKRKVLYKIRQRMPTDAKKYAAVLTSLINTTPEKGRPLVKQYRLFHKKARFRFS